MTKKLLAVLALCSAVAAQQSGEQAVLMAEERTGVSDFRTRQADGRGVIVAVVDSGFDIGHPAFRATTTGEPKVIDVRDFSDRLVVPMGPVLMVPDDTLGLPSAQGGMIELGDFVGSAYRVGVLREELMEDSPLPDVNRDTAVGDELLDPPPGVEEVRYPRDDRDQLDVVLALVEDEDGRKVWECRIDLDGDRSVADEVSMRDYKERRQMGYLDEDRLVAFCLNVPETGDHVKIVLADSSHGSHVAGIIGGNDPEGIVGIAPGVQFIFIKVGYGRRRGASATSRASASAFRYACEQGASVVNYSYGGAPQPSDGQWFNARYVDELSREFGTLFCISAGNNGPGLFTIGTPSTAAEALTVGNFWTREGAADMLGYTNLPNDVLIGSSSRGPLESGRLKPDLLAPGFAINSVPLYGTGYSFMNGTSMASPHAAGCAALLISGLRQAGNWPEPSADRVAKDLARRQLKTAMVRSGKPLPHTLKIEQGGGVLHVPTAWQLLSTMRSSARRMPPVIHVRTGGNLYRQEGRGMESAVIRDGFRDVTSNTFRVIPEFPEGTSEAKQAAYLGKFRLVSDADWLWTTGGSPSGTGLGRDTSRDSFWMGSSGGSITVAYDAESLAPGIHVGTISGYPIEPDVIGSSEPVPAFELVTTYIVPLRLDTFGARRHTEQVEIGDLPIGSSYRAFVQIPYGATALELSVASEDPLAAVQARVITPYGQELGSVDLSDDAPAHLDEPHRARGVIAIPEPGVYEIVFRRYFRSREEVPFSYSMRLMGVDLAPGRGLDFPKDKKSISAEVVNAYAPVGVSLAAEANAWVRSRKLSGGGNFIDVPIVAIPGASNLRVRFEVEQDPVARAIGLYAEVFDAKGRPVTKGGVYRSVDIPPNEYDLSWGVSGSGRYTVRIHRFDHAGLYGFGGPGERRPAWLHGPAELELEWTETHVLRRAVALTVKPENLSLERYEAGEFTVSAPKAPGGPFAVERFFGSFTIRAGNNTLKQRFFQGEVSSKDDAAGKWLDSLVADLDKLTATRNARRRDLMSGLDAELASGWFQQAAKEHERKLGDGAILDRLHDLVFVADGLVRLYEPLDSQAKAVESLRALSERASRIAALWEARNEVDADVAAASDRFDKARGAYQGWLKNLRVSLKPGHSPKLAEALKALEEAEDAEARAPILAALADAWAGNEEEGLRHLGVLIAEQRRRSRSRHIGDRYVVDSLEGYLVARGLEEHGGLVERALEALAGSTRAGFEGFLEARGSTRAGLADVLAARAVSLGPDSLEVVAEDLAARMTEVARGHGFGPALDSGALVLHVLEDADLKKSIRSGVVVRSWPEVPAADTIEMGAPQLDMWLRFGPDAEGVDVLERAASVLAEALVTSCQRPVDELSRHSASAELAQTLLERLLQPALGLECDPHAADFLLALDVLGLRQLRALEHACRGPAPVDAALAARSWRELSRAQLGGEVSPLVWQLDGAFASDAEDAFERVLEAYTAHLAAQHFAKQGWENLASELTSFFSGGPLAAHDVLRQALAPRQTEEADGDGE